MCRILVFFLSLSFVPLFGVELHEGSLKGAPYRVAVPEKWETGKVFFHVHGWRPDDALHQADLDLKDPFYQSLLKQGWIIGRTAFLKNGVDHDAHTVALRDLKSWIEEKFGPIKMLILEGESTAGTLVLRIAEQDVDLADGVIAMGAYIDLNDPSVDSYLSATPMLPSILMSNMTEIADPLKYAVKAESAVIQPSLWPLLRPGHVNVNWVERKEALTMMVQAIETGVPLPLLTDGTRAVPTRDTGTSKEDGAIVNVVTAINPFYGNAFLGFHPDELLSAGLVKGKSFEIEIAGNSWPVLFGDSYGDVPLGEWVAFPTADEFILLVRNHKSAVETAGLEVGDQVRISLE
ncbi:MAG: SAM hydroxide adenosyltransferase [Verrucomicrobiota bacterium]